jgi:hypothetical protein
MDMGWWSIGIVVIFAAAVVALTAATGGSPARRASIADKALAKLWRDPTGTARSGRRTSRRPAHPNRHLPQRPRSGPGNHWPASSTR